LKIPDGEIGPGRDEKFEREYDLRPRFRVSAYNPRDHIFIDGLIMLKLRPA
jgi:hypothetical protein